jgi:hypothetical protein
VPYLPQDPLLTTNNDSSGKMPAFPGGREGTDEVTTTRTASAWAGEWWLVHLSPRVPETTKDPK